MDQRGLSHVGLRTADVDRAARFYTSVLGGAIERKRSEPDRRVWVRVRGVMLEIAEIPAWAPLDESQRRALPMVAFAVTPDEVDSLVARLDAAAVPHEGPALKATGESVGVYFADPDGNPLSLSCPVGYPVAGLQRRKGDWAPAPFDWDQATVQTPA